ncbi:hypothetical protein LTS08_003115 [Lithohypha guttulata]|uniref:CMP/dCMP-type deaminase domain-containing protein n=1 Tax=Lithohypha guttulata TaxID=1690604 RepID=A0AAN7Y6K1_9EURO|nr:hypothetical protein LTR05_004706 [Lithohypha guttulata]KAK5103697.1 hypothetical protein LTS08_003115 [Lithohypha guttulata]
MSISSKETSLKYLSQTIDLAKKSPPKSTNFRVGCVIVSFSSVNPAGTILSTGYTLELPGNTHAEQCALTKLADNFAITEPEIFTLLPSEAHTTLYTSLEPCNLRLSGNLPCVQRIIATRHNDSGIQKVVFGAKEPSTFVKDSQSCKALTEAGIEWEYLPDLEEEILKVAMEGHDKKDVEAEQQQKQQQGGIQPRGGVNKILGVMQSARDAKEERTKAENGNVEAHGSSSNRQTQAGDGTHLQESSAPRNPKKRMMEAPPGGEDA